MYLTDLTLHSRTTRGVFLATRCFTSTSTLGTTCVLTTVLGVEVVVPKIVVSFLLTSPSTVLEDSSSTCACFSSYIDVPLLCPVHEEVCRDERRDEVKNLSTASSIGVEDSCVCCASEKRLSVGCHGICSDTLLRLGAYVEVA
jgi:hypothetical protein